MAQRLSDVMRTQPIQGSMRLSDVMSQRPQRLFEVDPDSTVRQAESLVGRFGKQLYNIIPSIIKGTLETAAKAAPGELDMRRQAQQEILAGSLGPEEAERMREFLAKGKQQATKLQPIPVPSPETWKEKGVDIAAGIAGFVAQITLLKKGLPKTIPTSVVWEMQNLMSGGTPGMGAASYAAFSAPGKIIKGVSIAAKAGRVVSESILLGGMSAAHQKIETGEINAMDVLISAGIPLGLRAAGGAKGVLKRALKAKNPKVIKAVNEVIAKKDINIYRTTDNSRKGITEAEVIRKGERYVDKVTGKDVVLDVTVSGSGLVKPVKGIDIANKRLLETTATAKQLSKTEVKVVHKALRRRQAGRGTKATAAAIRAGRTPGEAIRAGRRAYGGKAKVPKVTPPDLTPEQWVMYDKKILELYPPQGRRGAQTQFQRTGTQEALNKLKAGDIPTNYDFHFLDKLLGRETTLELHRNLVRHRTYGLWDIPVLVRDGLKSMFGYDPQVARQARGIAARHPLIYAESVKVNLQAYGSQTASNRIIKKLESSPGWELSKKQGINYLGTTPWTTVKEGTRLQQYGSFTDFLLSRKNRYLKSWGKLLAASERGANAGLNTSLKKLWDVGQKDLASYQTKNPMTPLQIEKWNKVRVNDINAFMKRVVAKNKKAKEIQKAANWILFSSAHTISRPIASWRSIKNLAVGKGIRNRTYAAQLTATNIASLSALSSIGAYIGHKARLKDPTKEPSIDSSNDPTNSMWGKFRVGNDVIDLSGGDNSTYRLLARIGVSAYMYGRKITTGREGAAPDVGEELMRYLTSRETVLIGLGKTLATGKDWLGEPIGRKEAILKQFPMEFLISIVEAGNADGMWEAIQGGDITEASKDLIKNIPVGIVGLAGAGTATYKVPTATTRYRFRNIISNKEYQKEWNDLTAKEQGKLSRKHRKIFKIFEGKIKAERVEKPYSPERIIEEERKSRIRITKMLSKDNRSKIEGVSVAVSRRPKNFFLNDERYQKYQELTAKYLNERLSKIRLEGRSDKVRTKMLEVAVKMAKDKAFRDIRREMK